MCILATTKLLLQGYKQGSLSQMAVAVNLQHRYTYEYCRHCGVFGES